MTALTTLHAAARHGGRGATARGGASTPAARTAGLVRLEARILLRRRGTAVSLVFVPLLLVAVLLVNTPATDAAWGTQTGQFVVVALLITVYLPTATVLAARREAQVLKRMRTSEVGPVGLLTAVVAPLAVLGAVQAVVVAVAVLALGGPLPQQPLLASAAVALTLVQAVALGVAVAALTRTSEQVQFSTTPVLVAAAVAAQLISASVADEVRLGALAVPMAAGSSMLARAWAGAEAAPATTLGQPSALVELALLLAWTAAAVLLARRCWRWEPRG